METENMKCRSVKTICAIVILLIMSSTPIFAIGNYGVNLDLWCYSKPSNPFSEGQCTWYCWGRAAEKLGIELYWNDGHFGNAGEWYNRAAAAGYRCDTTPEANSIMVYGYSDSLSYGHVAFVEAVDGDNLYISEFNYNVSLGYSEATVNCSSWQYTGTYGYYKSYKLSNRPIGYIHLGTPPNPPSAPVISANREYMLDNETITITWGGVSGASYYEYYLTEYPEGYAYTNFTDHGTLYAPSVSFYGTDLKNGHYSFFVHAANSAGWSPQSNWIEFDVYASGYVPVATEVYDGHIYALYDQEMSWSFARDLCADMGGHLLTINDAVEQAYVETLINKGSKYGYWLGGTNFTTTETDVNGPYRWVTKEAFSYTNWGAGEPNFSGERGTRERFAEIRRDNNGKWNDAYNTNRSGRGFILEIEPAEDDVVAEGSFKGSRYMIVDRNTTWSEAESYCEMLGGHLDV